MGVVENAKLTVVGALPPEQREPRERRALVAQLPWWRRVGLDLPRRRLVAAAACKGRLCALVAAVSNRLDGSRAVGNCTYTSTKPACAG